MEKNQKHPPQVTETTEEEEEELSRFEDEGGHPEPAEDLPLDDKPQK